MSMSAHATRSNEKMIDAMRFAMAARQLEVLAAKDGKAEDVANYQRYQQHYLDEALHYHKLGIGLYSNNE
jgi:hypothetical protein